MYSNNPPDEGDSSVFVRLPNTQPSNLHSILLAVFLLCMFMSLFCNLFLFLKNCWNTKPNTPYTYTFLGFYTTTTNDFSHLCVITFSNKFNFYSVYMFDSAVSGTVPGKNVNFAFHNSPDEGDSSVFVSYQTQNHLTFTVYC